MRVKFIVPKLLGFAGILLLSSCEQADEVAQSQNNAVPEAAMQKIANLGFRTEGVRAIEGGYLVEGDIKLSYDDLDRTDLESNVLRVGESEQYRTSYLVTRLPRTITVRVYNLPAVYAEATDIAIQRYNNLGLRINFRRVTSSANITLVGFNEPPKDGYITLGSAGFPSRSGNPYNRIDMNTNEYAYGTDPDVYYLASVIQHEIGHCIGFRHTDYMDRSYSCGGQYYNEGPSRYGAIHIPGTPTGPDPNSWMLSCSNGGNRTFNSNDVSALNYLY